jgi:hypothetical protein
MRFSKKWLLAIGVVPALAIAFGAYAYFTSTGTGTGTATVGSAGATVSIDGTIDPTNGVEDGPNHLVPGDTTGAEVTFRITNDGSATAYVQNIYLDGVDAYTDDTKNELIADCVGSWFTMDAVSVEKSIPAGEFINAPNLGKLKLVDYVDPDTEKPVDQTACQGAYIVAHFTTVDPAS